MATGLLTRRREKPEHLVRAFNEVREDLVGTLLFVLGSQEDAQDTAQETFLKCWRARAQLPRIRNVRAWIFRVALNTAKDLQRNAWRRRARPLDPTLSPPMQPELSPADHLITTELLERIRLALVNLRPEEQQVFLMRQNDELTYEQIALRCRRPVGTVKTQMRSALHKLRQVFSDVIACQQEE
jgi:RNA polymerase sigma-70 factor (ECF subfamily)